MNVRADVVSLLTVTDLGSVLDSPDRSGWKRDDGTPLTVEEQALVASANRQELLAGQDFAERAVRYETEQVADMTRVLEIANPYFDRLADGSNFGDVMDIATAAERTELETLLGRLAPDGYLFIPAGPTT